MAHDVFISYSTKDKIIADAVCAKLEEYKIRAWIAPRDIPAGANFGQSIIRAINSCKIFILIWSADTNTSEHILNEINQAFDQGITIIPFRIQNVLPTDEMRYYFGRTHWLDAMDPPLENHIATLRDTILLSLGREPYSPPATASTSAAEEPSQKTIQPATETDKDNKPAVEEKTTHEPPVVSPPGHQSQKKDQSIRPKVAVPGKLKEFLPIAAGILIVFTLLILYLTGVFKGSPPAEVAQVSQSSMPAVAVTSTSSPIEPTSTSSPPATAIPVPSWEEEANLLAEPILAAINDLAPDFADDFSEVDDGWDYGDGGGGTCAEHPTPNMMIADGAMKVNIEPSCHVSLDHPYLLAGIDDFVYQLDLNFSSNSMFEIGFNRSDRFIMGFGFNHSHWEIAAQKPNSEEWQVEQSGDPRIDPSSPTTFTLLKKDTTFLFYLNSELLASFETELDDANGLELSILVSSGQNSANGYLELDNIKFWDLDRLDIANHFQASDLVNEAIAFTEPILAAVKDAQPAIDDDFSNFDPSWSASPDIDGCDPAEDTTYTISEGSLKFSIKNCQVGSLQSISLMPEEHVLQVDLIFPETDLVFGVRNWTEDGLVDFYINSPSGHVQSNIMAQEEIIERIDGDYLLDFSKPITLTIINQSPAFLVYADSTLLIANLTNQNNQGSFTIDFTIDAGTDSGETKTLIMDNLKLWGLPKN